MPAANACSLNDSLLLMLYRCAMILPPSSRELRVCCDSTTTCFQDENSRVFIAQTLVVV